LSGADVLWYIKAVMLYQRAGRRQRVCNFPNYLSQFQNYVSSDSGDGTAGPELRPEAGARHERTLEGVGSRPSLGAGEGRGTVHTRLLRGLGTSR
jgi:hypothetical protein